MTGEALSFGRRDRFVITAANLVLRCASRDYREFVQAAIRRGVSAALAERGYRDPGIADDAGPTGIDR